MLKISDHEYTFNTTDYHLRAYLDPTGKESPLFVIREPADNRGTPLPEQRVDLAIHLSAQLGLTPDRVTWAEQRQDGSLVQFEFRPFVQELRPYEQEMPRQEMERAERAGQLQPERITRYNVAERELQRDAIEGRAGETLPVPRSYAEQQNHDFERLYHAWKWNAPERQQL